MKLDEIVYEMSIAAWGDWNKTNEAVGLLTYQVLKLKYEKISSLKIKEDKYEFFKLKTQNFYILGKMISNKKTDETAFMKVLEITLHDEDTIAKKLKITKKLFRVSPVKVNDSLQGNGIASTIYQFLVKTLNFNLLGDEIQYFGARKLWAKLSKSNTITVDIVDISEGKYLEKDVKLHHGFEDFDYDQRVYEYGYATKKKHIRLILKDIN